LLVVAAGRDVAWLLELLELLELFELAGRDGRRVGVAVPCGAGAARGCGALCGAAAARAAGLPGSAPRSNTGARFASILRGRLGEAAAGLRSSS
jgi:hypothetical protein